jgi:hypothetical protein
MARRWIVPVIPCLALLALGAAALAADEQAPDPIQALKTATKNLAAESRDGYGASCEVQGGISKSASHQLDVMTTVRESYTGEIRGDIMHVPAMNVFRNSQKGALSDGVQWYALQARPEGKKLDRLFAFPIQLLSQASEKPEKIEWLASTESATPTEEERAEGGTAVAKQLTQDQLYHRLRVHVPDEVALKYFIEVQNSGALSGC